MPFMADLFIFLVIFSLVTPKFPLRPSTDRTDANREMETLRDEEITNREQ